MSQPTPALEMRGVAKSFGDVIALDGVDLVVRAGSVHALLGENGAGKSTLMRVAYGMLAPDRGDVRTLVRGVGMVHQHLSLIPNMTAAENIALGGRGLFRPREARALTTRVSREAGLAVDADARVADLSIVEQQRVEILKALARDARLLILDEPSAVLAPSETDELLRWLRAFADRGGGVVLVTHKLREALAIADDVTVLRRGRVTHSGPARDATADALARAMFPDAPPPSPRPALNRGETIVRAIDVTLRDARGVARLSDASFEVARGEIVGVAAIEGSGHRELIAALAGLRRPDAGTLELPERIALIPADRGHEALIPELTLAENVALRGLGARRGLMPWVAIAERAARLIERFSIAAPGPGVAARALSGGNQQRLVVARELEDAVDLVVADNPTRGLDLRATVFVHEQLRLAAAQGAGVVVHSSDVDEVLSLATRMLVVFSGRVSECALDRDAVGRAMLGAGA